MVGIVAIAVESVYISSRILRAMSAQGLIPEFISRVDKAGRPRYASPSNSDGHLTLTIGPRWALAITITVAVILTYMNLSGK
jgi:amino acid transporter